MSRFAIKCLSIILVIIGTSSVTHAEPAPASRTKVYLLRGLTNVLSPGIDQLAEELRRRNIPETVANHAFSSSMATEAIEDCKSGRVSSIVLVGHSMGASAAVSMAEQLQAAGVRVSLLVTFDPVVTTAVPGNVHLLRNFYVSNGVGKPVQRGEHFHGMLQNVDMKSNSDIGHISVTTAPAIQKQVMAGILAASNTRCR